MTQVINRADGLLLSERASPECYCAQWLPFRFSYRQQTKVPPRHCDDRVSVLTADARELDADAWRLHAPMVRWQRGDE